MSKSKPHQSQLLDTFLEKEYNRRKMLGLSLQAGLGGLLAAHLGPALTGCFDDTKTPPGPDAGPDTYLVGIAGGGDALAAAGSALALAGGLDFVQQGQSVFLKLASNAGDLYPYSTNPDLLVWIAGQLQEAGAGSVRCGDAPFFGDNGPVFVQNGLQQAADQAGIELVDFRQETDWVQVPQDDASAWSASEGMRLPAVMVNSDHIVNLPNLKTHFIPGVTLALKLQIGAVHRQDRELALASHANIHEKIAQINAQFTPSLSILDGYEACINGGPNPGYPGTEAGHVGLAIVSSDRIATDVAGIAALRMHTSEAGLLNLDSPWDHLTIQSAVEYGLGISGPGEFDVEFADVDDAVKQTLLDDTVG